MTEYINDNENQYDLHLEIDSTFIHSLERFFDMTVKNNFLYKKEEI